MVNPDLIAALVVIIVAAGAAPIIGVLVLRSHQLVSSARSDASAQQKHARLRLRTLLVIYGGTAAVLLGVGLSQVITHRSVSLVVVGLCLMAMGLGYAAAVYRAVVRVERSPRSL